MNHNGNEENNHITYITAFLRIPMGIYPDGTFFIRGQYDISYEVDGDDDDDDDQQIENDSEDKNENNEQHENDEPHDDNENEQNKDSDQIKVKDESIPIETNNLEEILGGAFLQLFGQGGGETSLLSSSSSTTTTSSPVFVSKGDIKPRIFPKLHTNNKNKTFRMKRSVEAACGKSAFMKK